MYLQKVGEGLAQITRPGDWGLSPPFGAGGLSGLFSEPRNLRPVPVGVQV